MRLLGPSLSRVTPGAAELELPFPAAAVPPAQAALGALRWHRPPSRHQPGVVPPAPPFPGSSLPPRVTYNFFLAMEKQKWSSLLPSVPCSRLTHLAGPSGPHVGKAD